MKTFKLVSMDLLEKMGDELHVRPIELLDGLIINREDDGNQWLVEAYMDKKYFRIFRDCQEDDREILMQVKITKKTNPPATVLTRVVSLNDIGEHMNVLCIGKLVDRKQEQVEQMLQELIEEGYQGEELLEMFKKRNKKAQGTSS
ncbi:YwpF-like family protein [Salirhabdus salicampi]|uniref:YwpF-like family protein n=1 Tax=Salirhabdus salicampi TaxID=476102 RepID=UPI0020C59A08|nr:YwpF-like family protein [Salirhabdus salicampi]MCP8615993.1 YwpF-like family protein [Salirhabdus salicampi]